MKSIVFFMCVFHLIGLSLDAFAGPPGLNLDPEIFMDSDALVDSGSPEEQASQDAAFGDDVQNANGSTPAPFDDFARKRAEEDEKRLIEGHGRKVANFIQKDGANEMGEDGDFYAKDGTKHVAEWIKSLADPDAVKDVNIAGENEGSYLVSELEAKDNNFEEMGDSEGIL